MEYISPLLRTDFREFCVSNFVLRQIRDIFNMAGVEQGKLSTNQIISGQRRTLVEEHYASINWNSKEDTDKFLKVLECAFAQSYLTVEAKNILKEESKVLEKKTQEFSDIVEEWLEEEIEFDFEKANLVLNKNTEIKSYWVLALSSFFIFKVKGAPND